MQQRLVAAERNVARGASVATACRWVGLSPATYYRWRREAAETGQDGDIAASEKTRRKIIRVARTAFLDDGFDVSLRVIAKAARVSRRTIYNLFGDRGRLFGQVVQELYDEFVVKAHVPQDQADLPTVLEAWGRQLIRHSVDRDAIGLMKVTLEESRAHPELAVLAYAIRANSGAIKGTAAIEARFEQAIADGEIEPVNTALAAQAFVGSCIAHLRHRALIGVEAPTSDQIDERLHLAIAIFLQGLGYRSRAQARN